MRCAVVRGGADTIGHLRTGAEQGGRWRGGAPGEREPIL